MQEICNHIRRSNPQPTAGKWRMKCDCGWHAAIDRYRNDARDKTPDEAYNELNALFLEHVPAHERRTYVLVDARVHTPADPETGQPEMLYGNWIMPEAVPVRLISTSERDGMRYAIVAELKVPEAEPIELPIGEIRTADGRVFRCA